MGSRILFGGPHADFSTAFYRMAEMYFATQAQMNQTLGSPEGKSRIADLPKFATGGVTMVVGSVEG